MKTINWSGYEWITEERWGQLHADKDFVWYDKDSVHVNSDKTLSLFTINHKKDFMIDGKIHHSKIGVGLVSNKTKFSYGYFEIEGKIPKGANNWSAFWMWSYDSWPPEIDVFESYTNNNGSLFNIFNNWKIWNIWNVQTNVFYRDKNENIAMIRGQKHWFNIFKKSPSKRFIKYGVDWQEDYIKIYYDDRLVKTIDDEYIISKFKGKQMNVIINNSLSKETKNHESEFIIKYFIYRENK